MHVDLEEHRIVDFIVGLERRLDASRFTVDRERVFARRQRIASGFIEIEGPHTAPRIVLDQPGEVISEDLKHCIRLRWTRMQRDLRAQGVHPER